MSKYLVIVESPAKARTINKYLGKDYSVKASVGHVIDLPVSRLGVDVENNFAPQYEVIKGKKKIVSEIAAEAKKAEKIFLAPDPDREGEAIAWHIADLIEKSASKRGPAPEIYRVLFNEITKKGVEAGMRSPSKVDLHKVDAQQARRILDRLVGYQLSPLLWDKVQRNLSAGRVQSVAVRLVVDRETEIKAFKAEEYWTLDVSLEGSKDRPFKARLFYQDGKKIELVSQEGADAAILALQKAPFFLKEVEKKERVRRPLPPFVTSTLQQDAARQLGFTAKKTMTLAQRLYEGVTLADGESVGLITYMRTDSTRLSADALTEARAWIGANFAPAYLPKEPQQYTRKASAQDAHEAIRPTSATHTPDSVADSLERDMLRLYTLIWRRFVASQMASALYDQTTFHIDAGRFGLRASGSILRFNGFLALYEEKREEGEEDSDRDDRLLPDLSAGEALTAREFHPEQHFTQPPPRYTEASLVKELEERGIGRPSTYAAIISTIQEKKYVEKVQNRFHPTELGKVVTQLLVAHFADILAPDFTARLESELDEIEGGTLTLQKTLSEFYKKFKPDLDAAKIAMTNLKRQEIKTDLSCPKCSAPILVKWGKNGEFLACSAYPDCTHTGEFSRGENGEIVPKAQEVSDAICTLCSAPMLVKRGRFGRFLACSRYPDCTGTQAIPIGVACPDCGAPLSERRSKRGKTFYGCTTYPACKFASWDKPLAEPCPQCGAKYLVEKTTKSGVSKRCAQRECGYKVEG